MSSRYSYTPYATASTPTIASVHGWIGITSAVSLDALPELVAALFAVLAPFIAEVDVLLFDELLDVPDEVAVTTFAAAGVAVAVQYQ
ncbi:MAG TPA: hypothetical protein VF261_02940 [Candidatus Saccharimonadales bacterium]